MHSVYHGTESLSFLGPKIWDLVPVELKEPESLYSSKFKIKNWVPFERPSRICKIYIQPVGFFWKQYDHLCPLLLLLLFLWFTLLMSFFDSIKINIYMFICVCICVYIYVYIFFVVRYFSWKASLISKCKNVVCLSMLNKLKINKILLWLLFCKEVKWTKMFLMFQYAEYHHTNNNTIK